jgi:hypothetical protein
MNVRAKFFVESVTYHKGEVATIRLLPVTKGCPENDTFYRWTPAGEIVLQTVNRTAADAFTPGQELYVDFVPVIAEESA